MTTADLESFTKVDQDSRIDASGPYPEDGMNVYLRNADLPIELRASYAVDGDGQTPGGDLSLGFRYQKERPAGEEFDMHIMTAAIDGYTIEITFDLDYQRLQQFTISPFNPFDRKQVDECCRVLPSSLVHYRQTYPATKQGVWSVFMGCIGLVQKFLPGLARQLREKQSQSRTPQSGD